MTSLDDWPDRACQREGGLSHRGRLLTGKNTTRVDDGMYKNNEESCVRGCIGGVFEHIEGEFKHVPNTFSEDEDEECVDLDSVLLLCRRRRVTVIIRLLNSFD